MSTIFEKIIAREIPAHIVYEDDLVISFLDISQATSGHTLVVPKKAFENIFEMPDDLLAHTIKITKKIADACKKAFPMEGLNILSNNGTIAGQTVFHFHFHVIPRYEPSDVMFKFTNHMNETTKEDYKKRALQIIEAL
jgi:histidine triad (HIT) family protein